MASGVFVIAEAGVNHNGSVETALRMVVAAADAGADAVKFQTFRAEDLASPDAPKAAYQEAATGHGAQKDMLRSLELDRQAHQVLLAECRSAGIDFMSSPFDSEGVDLLVELGLETIKVPSGQITDLPYLERVGAAGKRVILSTGMAEIDEIGAALDVFETLGTRRDEIVLLHCTTEYPVPMEDVNLRAISELREEFGLPVGYSDHTVGIEIPVAAVALGACVLEKHFTLDRSMDGPDHAASLEPDELAAMVRAVRDVETALGDGHKRRLPREEPIAAVVRKSLMAAGPIRRGQTIEERDLVTKRPGTGISPMRMREIVGTVASRDYEPDEMIEP